jgi:sialate O-acetylesterase
MKRLTLLLLSLLAICITNASSQVRLPNLISDGMVLQRDTRLVIWGWASPGEPVSISFQGRRFKTKASTKGTWSVDLPEMKSGGPYTMKISGKNEIVVKDILIGDVWLCSGQSNMVHQMDIHDVTYAADIAKANYPEIRHFKVPTNTDMNGPVPDIREGSWQRAVSDEVRPFSAVAYFFARKVYEKYHIPIGLINSSVGGTPIEAWISEEGFRKFPESMETI